MNIVISSNTDNPIYQQLFDQINAQIISGELPGDFCLPPIRTVAKELRISVIPVKMAWEELERQGFIYTMVGKGCFVSPLPSDALAAKRNLLAQKKLSQDLSYCKSLGLSLSEILELIKKLHS